jgi:hypothetical protein
MIYNDTRCYLLQLENKNFHTYQLNTSGKIIYNRKNYSPNVERKNSKTKMLMEMKDTGEEI